MQRITDWDHYRAATVLGIGADTLRMQEDIERLANTACRAILIRAEDGKVIAGFEPPKVRTNVVPMFTIDEFWDAC